MPPEAGTSTRTISDSISETLESRTLAPGKPRKKKRQTLSQAAFRKKSLPMKKP